MNNLIFDHNFFLSQKYEQEVVFVQLMQVFSIQDMLTSYLRVRENIFFC